MGTSMLGYSRVSTEEQADSRAGLDAQEHAIRDEAKRRGWEVTMLSDPGKSGKFVNPQLRKALELLAAGQADALIVSKMDRLARSLAHAVDIIDLAKTQGWSLVVLDLGVDLTTPTGRAMAMTMAVFAELERELISQRTKDGMAAPRTTQRPPAHRAGARDRNQLRQDRADADRRGRAVAGRSAHLAAVHSAPHLQQRP